MVVIAAAVCTKSGKALISRQFVEITRSRIEGLLAAFHKLVGLSSKQHTFIETETVRYLYQSLEDLYVVIITNKSSNIVEDLETLHIITKLVPEYSKSLDEVSICKHAFELVFAFDEVIALGYREKVTLQQVKTFTEMDSQEEKIHEMIEKNKERMAKKEANRKRLEIEKERREREKMGLSGFSSGGIGRSSISSESTSYESYTQPYISGSEKTMSVSSKRSSISSDNLANRTSSATREPKKERKGLVIKKTSPANEQIEAMRMKGEIEEDVVDTTQTVSPTAGPLKEEYILFLMQNEIVEKLFVELNRDGGLEKMEVRGEFLVEIKDEKYDKIYIKMKNETAPGQEIQFRTHPNIDSERWKTKGEIALVSTGGSSTQQNNANTTPSVTRSYPINTPTSVLKWRLLSRDIKWLPLVVSCWPVPSKDITLVTVEYELCNQQGFEVINVLIKIPIVAKAPPNVTQAVGSYKFDPKNSVLIWEIPLINNTNRKGTIEFELAQWESGKSDSSSLFPITVNFTSDHSLCNLEVLEVRITDGGDIIKFTQVKSLSVENYVIK